MPAAYEAQYDNPRPQAQFLTQLVRGLASEDIPIGYVVAAEDGAYRIATSDDGLADGVAVNKIGPEVHFIPNGLVEMGDWSEITGQTDLIPGSNYYLTADGRMDIIIPGSGWIVRVGKATSERILNVTFNLRVML